MPCQTDPVRPILPTELWQQILFFLGKSEIQRLRSVNSLFLDFALNSRYYDVTLFQLYDNKLYDSFVLCKLMRRTLHLRQPEISRRIRSLRLNAMDTYLWHLYTTNDRLSIQERLSSSLYTLKFWLLGPNFPTITHDLLVSLDNLRTLSISTCSESDEAFLSLVSVIWKHQFHKLGPEAMTLRTLRINYDGGIGLQDVLHAPQSTPELERYREALGKLDRLDLRICQLDCSGTLQQESWEDVRFLAGFLGLLTATHPINSSPGPASHARFTSNLTTLSMQLCCGDAPSNSVKVIEYIFGILSTSSQESQTPFPNLSHLSIVVTNTHECPSTILDFIALQRHTITHLRTSSNILHSLPNPMYIILFPSEVQLEEHWDRLSVMTRLTHLEIASAKGCHSRFEDASTLWSYLIRASPTLTDDGLNGIRSMIIDSKLVFSYDDLHWLFYAQTPSRISRPTPARNPDLVWMPTLEEALSRIQHLSLNLFVLSPAHLNIILTNIPTLRSLHISVFARAEKVPFRPSAPIEAGCNECSNELHAWVSVPRDQEEKDRLYPSFLEELDQLEQKKTNVGYSRNEELEELKVRLERVEERVLKAVTKALKGAYPGVKRVIVGNRIWVDHGVFDETW